MNKIICPNGKSFSRNDRKTNLNNNVCVCGTSGTGKTRNVIIPNMLELSGNYVVTDPKGFLYKNYARYFISHGYIVKNLSFNHPEKSIHYNPLDFISDTHSIQKLAYAFVYADKNIYSSKDPYWDEQSLFLINSIFAYLVECKEKNIPEIDPNLINTIEYIRKSAVRSLIQRRDFTSPANKYMYIYEAALDNYKQHYGDSFATKQYENLLSAPEKTYNTIVTSALSKFSSIETDEIAGMLQDNEVDIEELVTKKCIYFIEVSDTDSSMDLLINIFFSQLMNALCEYADEKCKNGRLPRDIVFIMDDFPSYKIENFDKIVNNIRSRGISVIITVQTLDQLNNVYKNGNAIISNCDTLFFMGTNDLKTAEQISYRINTSKYEILNMPVNTSCIIRRGTYPEFASNKDFNELVKTYF